MRHNANSDDSGADDQRLGEEQRRDRVDRAKPERRTARDVVHAIFKHLPLFLILPLVIIILIIVGTLAIRPVYEASSKIRIENVDYEDIGLSGRAERPQTELFIPKAQQINTEIDLAKSEFVLRAIVEEIELWRGWAPPTMPEEERIRYTIERLAARLVVEPSRDSWVMIVRVQDTDPELAAQIIDVHAQKYLDWHLEVNKLPEAAKFYQEKLEKEQGELDTLQRQFLTLKQTEQVVSYDAEIDQMLKNKAFFENKLTEVKTSIFSSEAQIRIVKQLLAVSEKELVPDSEIAKLRLIEDLSYRLLQALIELQILQRKYTENHERVQSINEQIKSLREFVREEVNKVIAREETDLGKLIAERQALEHEIAAINTSLLDRQVVEAPYKNLESQIQIKQEIISNLSKKYTDSLYAGQTDIRIGKAKLISKSGVPTAPVFPNLGLNLLIGIPLALLFALALVLALEYFDRTVSTPEKAARRLGLPVLATLNKLDLNRYPIFLR